MIETKEQYSNVLEQMNVRGLGGSASATHETIEALRRFVRAHDAVENGTISFDLQHKQVQELSDSRKALPNWIMEEPG